MKKRKVGKHCKITPEMVIAIRNSNDVLKAIADDYKISIGQVSKIKNNKVWKWVELPTGEQ